MNIFQAEFSQWNFSAKGESQTVPCQIIRYKITQWAGVTIQQLGLLPRTWPARVWCPAPHTVSWVQIDVCTPPSQPIRVHSGGHCLARVGSMNSVGLWGTYTEGSTLGYHFLLLRNGLLDEKCSFSMSNSILHGFWQLWFIGVTLLPHNLSLLAHTGLHVNNGGKIYQHRIREKAWAQVHHAGRERTEGHLCFTSSCRSWWVKPEWNLASALLQRLCLPQPTMLR